MFFVLTVRGQNKAKELFQAAITDYENGEYYKAAIGFKEIVDNHKRFEYYGQSFYNTAYSYHQADSLNLAIEWYEKIRQSKLKDDERVGGRGLFEPYANYKHNATFNIATIEYGREDYAKALKYYSESLEKYPYYNESGTDLRIRKNRLIINVTDCLEQLGRYEEALLTIVSESLDSQGSSNYSAVVKRSIKLIENHFDKEEIKEQLGNSLASVSMNKKDKTFSIQFRQTEIRLHPYWLDDYSVEGIKKEIKESEFWIVLNED